MPPSDRMLPKEWLKPDWPAPAKVRGFMTTRSGGVSLPPYDSLNPASHVGDDPLSVAENRSILGRYLPAEPLWLNQVHGSDVYILPSPPGRGGGGERGVDQTPSRASPSPNPRMNPLPFGIPEGEGVLIPTADASVARAPGRVCAVLTADCLPVLFCDAAGTVVAAAHAGWRGLAGSVLERTVEAMRVPPGEVMAWLGAAIGPDSFEVGPEVREAFIEHDPLAATAFRPALPGTLDEAPHKWLADIYALARLRLARIGVSRVYGGGLCTLRDAERFYSFRRGRKTGRMASLIWLAE